MQRKHCCSIFYVQATSFYVQGLLSYCDRRFWTLLLACMEDGSERSSVVGCLLHAGRLPVRGAVPVGSLQRAMVDLRHVLRNSSQKSKSTYQKKASSAKGDTTVMVLACPDAIQLDWPSARAALASKDEEGYGFSVISRGAIGRHRLRLPSRWSIWPLCAKRTPQTCTLVHCNRIARNWRGTYQ